VLKDENQMTLNMPVNDNSIPKDSYEKNARIQIGWVSHVHLVCGLIGLGSGRFQVALSPFRDLGRRDRGAIAQ
jgi:hypothetical protein